MAWSLLYRGSKPGQKVLYNMKYTEIRPYVKRCFDLAMRQAISNYRNPLLQKQHLFRFDKISPFDLVEI